MSFDTEFLNSGMRATREDERDDEDDDKEGQCACVCKCVIVCVQTNNFFCGAGYTWKCEGVG